MRHQTERDWACNQLRSLGCSGIAGVLPRRNNPHSNIVDIAPPKRKFLRKRSTIRGIRKCLIGNPIDSVFGDRKWMSLGYPVISYTVDK